MTLDGIIIKQYMINNWGYDMQKKGNLTPFFWSYQFKKGL